MEGLILTGCVALFLILSVKAWELGREFDEMLDELLELYSQTKELNERQLRMLDLAEKHHLK